jgi:hypothetical protein
MYLLLLNYICKGCSHKKIIRPFSLIEKTNSERNKSMESGEEAFNDSYIKAFYSAFDRIMLGGMKENKPDSDKYFGKK